MSSSLMHEPLDGRIYAAHYGRRHPRVLAFAALALLPLLLLLSTSGPEPSHASPSLRGLSAYSPERLAAPPVFPTADAKPIAAGEQARMLNAMVPALDAPLTPAPALSILGRPVDFARAADCLTAAVYYESASETLEGQRAVAQVVLNRVRHPAFPKTVCGVVFQGSERVTGCQFSFTCDGSLSRTPSAAGWMRARAVAQLALAGYVEANVGLATHYHTVWVVPYWSSSLTKLRTIGAHIFYKWQGPWGEPAAFGRRYAGNEPTITPRSASETAPLLTAEGNLLDGAAAEGTPGQAGPSLSSPVGLELRNRVLTEPLAAKPRPLGIAARPEPQSACKSDGPAAGEKPGEACPSAQPRTTPIGSIALQSP